MMFTKNSPNILNPSIQFPKNTKLKKKHLIPICRVISKVENEKENLSLYKEKNKIKALNIGNKSRQVGKDITNFTQKQINLSNYLRNPISLRNNSLRNLNISKDKYQNNSFVNLNDFENLNFKNKKILSKHNSNKKINTKTRNQILEKIKKLSYQIVQSGKSHSNIFKNNCLNILTIRNSSKDKNKINNNNKESKKQKTTKIKKYSLSHQNSLSKLLTIKNIDIIKKIEVSSSVKKIKLPIPNSNINNYNILEKNKKKTTETKKEEEKLENKKEIEKKIIINPQFVTEYSKEIYKNLLNEEKQYIEKKELDYQYMKNQKEINPEMRSILNNWLIEVHDKFNYKEQTLFVCINIIDRYLSIKIIERSNYQLLGISALFIACKHEEVNLPNPKDFLFITENAYNSEQLYKMEYDILKCINFEILIPTQLDFFLSISYKFNLDEKEDLLGKYLLNICLLDYTLIKYPFSIIACSCLYICMKWFKKKDNITLSECYNNKYFNNNNISTVNIRNCIVDICILFDNIVKTDYQSAKGKYSQDKYKNISLLIVETKKNENIV